MERRKALEQAKIDAAKELESKLAKEAAKELKNKDKQEQAEK